MHDYSTSRWRSCKLLQVTKGGYGCYAWVIAFSLHCCVCGDWQASSLPAVSSTRTVEGCALPRA